MKKAISFLIECIFLTLSLEAYDPTLISTHKATITNLWTTVSPVYEELDEPPYSRYSRDITEFHITLDDGRTYHCDDFHMNQLQFPEYFFTGAQVEVKLYTKLNGYYFAEILFSNGQEHRFWSGPDPYWDNQIDAQVTDLKFEKVEGHKEIFILLSNGQALKGDMRLIEKLPHWLKIGKWVSLYSYPKQDGTLTCIVLISTLDYVGPFEFVQ